MASSDTRIPSVDANLTRDVRNAASDSPQRKIFCHFGQCKVANWVMNSVFPTPPHPLIDISRWDLESKPFSFCMSGSRPIKFTPVSFMPKEIG